MTSGLHPLGAVDGGVVGGHDLSQVIDREAKLRAKEREQHRFVPDLKLKLGRISANLQLGRRPVGKPLN